MTRRRLFQLLFASPLAALIPKPKIEFYTYDDHEFHYQLHKQMLDLAGIPYHQYNTSSGEWLGFSRGESIKPELQS